MCGLAFFWVISRSVKNASSVGASRLIGRPPCRARTPSPAGGRRDRAAPGAADRYQYVDVGSTCPSQVDSSGSSCLHVAAGGVAVDEGANRQAVADVSAIAVGSAAIEVADRPVGSACAKVGCDDRVAQRRALWC